MEKKLLDGSVCKWQVGDRFALAGFQHTQLHQTQFEVSARMPQPSRSSIASISGFGVSLMLPSLPPRAVETQLPGQLAAVEGGIAREFSQRLHGFHIVIRNDGLVLEGCTKTYFSKQIVQEAVVRAIGLPIVANRISVEKLRPIVREWQVLDCDPESDIPL